MSQSRETLTLNFVLKNDYQSEDDSAFDMRDAFKSAVDFGMDCRWIKESDCLQVDEELRGQVFVFEDFEGRIFSRFVKSHINSRVIGPRCLLTCMSKGIPVPNTKYPVLNLAMNRFSICVSGVPSDQKKELEKLVGYMGGKFSNKFLTSSTHLVVNSVLSEKCFKAREVGIPIMIKAWIEDVWKRSSIMDEEEVKSTMNEYKVPIFYNLKMTASGISEKEKNEIRDSVCSNGGTYTPEMRKETNILIVPVGKGEKFKFAERWKIKCLSPLWIKCCLKKGYAVQYGDYIIKSELKKCSTPMSTSNNMASLMNANDSDISVIPSDSARTLVGDTQVDSPQTIRQPIFKTPVKCAPRRESFSPKISDCMDYQALLNDTAVTDAKKCGPILDGCKVYLAGFKDNEEEKLRRILNYSGAIRYTELNDSVTHVIVGNPSKNDLENIKSVNHPLHVVTLKWLSTSIEKGSLERESNCPYFADEKVEKPATSKIPQQPSPLSKKGLQMLNPVRDISANAEPTIDRNLLETYSRALDPVPCEIEPIAAERSDVANREDLTRDRITQNSTSCNIFTGLSFTIVGHEPSAKDEIKKIISLCGGLVSEDFNAVDYIILPLEHTRKISNDYGSAEIVTSVWIQESYEENRIVEIKYHHRPLIVTRPMGSSELSHFVLTFSSYTVYQRQYLEQVATFLGARFQNVLSKKEAPERDIARTTHLVCALPEGVKYNAAKKWGLPIISERWLLDSFNQRKVLPLNSYLLCDDENSKSEEMRANARNVRTEATTSKSKTIEETRNNARANVTELPDGTPTNKQVTVQEISNHRPESYEKAPMSKQVKTIAKRSSYTIPELTEAVKNTHDRAFNLKGRLKETPESKDYPDHGLLAQFNRQASSIKKRKSDDGNEVVAVQTDSQRRKILRSDASAAISSQEEGVGWQDTFTDVPTDDVQTRISDSDPTPSSSTNTNNGLSKRVPPDQVERDQRLATADPVNRECNAAQESRTRTNQLFRSRLTFRNVMISVNNKEKKERCEAIVEGLGGKVIPKYDPDCPTNEKVTHLIIDELKKTEKLLCSIASGLWVLHSSYLEKCKEKNEFVQEEPFEWGNPVRTSLPAVKESRDSTAIAKAAFRWRSLIQAEGPSRRPFVDMRAVILNSAKEEPLQSLIRVVKSGGGRVLQKSDILKATHCLVLSVKHADTLPVPLERLAEKKVHYLPAVYLSDYLINDPPPTPQSCYFDSYKKLF